MSIDTGIKDKRILLVGACGVLGKAHAKLLAEHGAKLIIADRPGSTVLEDAEKLHVNGFEIDVADEQSIISVIQAAASVYGSLDGAVYNAAVTGEALATGGNAFPDFETYPLSLWQKAIDINLTGAFLFAREAGKILKAGGGGSLVNIASIYGVVGPDHRIYDEQPFRSFPAYSASKAGIIGLTRWLATWWAKSGIRVNCISPGGVYNGHNQQFVDAYSNRTPMGRMADREDITGMLIYLLSDSSKFCTGQNLVVDGGLTTW